MRLRPGSGKVQSHVPVPRVVDDVYYGVERQDVEQGPRMVDRVSVLVVEHSPDDVHAASITAQRYCWKTPAAVNEHGTREHPTLQPRWAGPAAGKPPGL